MPISGTSVSAVLAKEFAFNHSRRQLILNAIITKLGGVKRLKMDIRSRRIEKIPASFQKREVGELGLGGTH